MGYGSDGKRFQDSELGQNLHQPKWDTIRLMKFEKFFYHEHPVVANRSPVSILTLFIILLQLFLFMYCIMYVNNCLSV